MCGIVGIYGHPEAAKLAYLCLYSLQHRGQESAGIATSTGDRIHRYIDMGLVADVFTRDKLERLQGESAIGHVRYSTTGNSEKSNAQPFVVESRGRMLALAHNGNLTNAAFLRDSLESDGSIFQTTMDSEVIMHFIAASKEQSFKNKIIEALKKVNGAYSLVFLDKDSMIVARDPYGFRPIVLGKLDGAIIAASETCALDLIGAEYIRDVEAGEVVVVDKNGINSFKPFDKPSKRSLCIFEYIYFSRPDSVSFSRSVYDMRRGFGRQLAREHPVDADMIVPVPDSGIPAAIGYVEESGIPFQKGLVRNHYIGRTFIEPESEIRHFGVKIKLSPVRGLLEGKRVVVIDDSIVRGTTSKKIVSMIRRAGAAEVHVRISSPPTAWPCFYGIDTPTRKELVASKMSVEEIRDFITADSLGYLSYDGLYWFEKEKPGEWYCDACFTGNYPTQLLDAPHIEQIKKKDNI
jgi:amidophosphoribosyltransferase